MIRYLLPLLICIGCASEPQAPSAWSAIDSQTIVVTQPGTFRIAWDWSGQSTLWQSTNQELWSFVSSQTVNEATITNTAKTFYRISL